MSIDVSLPVGRQAQNWSIDDAIALRGDADLREVGESSMLDMIVEIEGLGRVIIID